MAREKPRNPIDKYVGERIRKRRESLGMSLEKLAKTVGVSYQQIQKYENGTDRVFASRLKPLAKALDVTESYLLDEVPEEIANKRPPISEEAEFERKLHAQDPEAIELNRCVQTFDRTQRRRLFELIKEMTPS